MRNNEKVQQGVLNNVDAKELALRQSSVTWEIFKVFIQEGASAQLTSSEIATKADGNYGSVRATVSRLCVAGFLKVHDIIDTPTSHKNTVSVGRRLKKYSPSAKGLELMAEIKEQIGNGEGEEPTEEINEEPVDEDEIINRVELVKHVKKLKTLLMRLRTENGSAKYLLLEKACHGSIDRFVKICQQYGLVEVTSPPKTVHLTKPLGVEVAARLTYR